MLWIHDMINSSFFLYSGTTTHATHSGENRSPPELQVESEFQHLHGHPWPARAARGRDSTRYHGMTNRSIVPQSRAPSHIATQSHKAPRSVTYCHAECHSAAQRQILPRSTTKRRAASHIAMQSHIAQRSVTFYHAVPHSAARHHILPRSTTKRRAASHITRQYHIAPRGITYCHAVPQSAVQHHILPRSTT